MTETVQSLVKWSVPLALRKGQVRHDERLLVETGRDLLQLVDGYHPLKQARMLDWGCGCKFAQAIVEYGVEVGGYTGVDIDLAMIAYLAETNRARDKLRFIGREIGNAMYNPDGPLMADVLARETEVAPASFDVITLFSVFTHLAPADTETLLKFLRTRIAPGGTLVFTAFVDETTELDFYDKEPDKPLLRAHYRKAWLEDLIARCGWRIRHFSWPTGGAIHQPHYVCTPAS